MQTPHTLRHNHTPYGRKELLHSALARTEMPLVWLEEPKTEVLFSNDTGAVVSCAASTAGGAPADVAWTAEDGRPFLPVAELVEVLSNGSLWLLPFAGHRYDAAVHRATVSCTVSSDQGALISRPSHIKAVVRRNYEAQVFDPMVMSGNTALLKCHLPAVQEGVLAVTSWQKDNTINIFPSLYGASLRDGYKSEINTISVGSDGLQFSLEKELSGLGLRPVRYAGKNARPYLGERAAGLRGEDHYCDEEAVRWTLDASCRPLFCDECSLRRPSC
ncbi:hypothetical protein FHG87_006070 [Trinorchestia longiramus]|nr:hypothetical protein FHG87_006070 [Trinorchestia longiramus]